MNLYPPRNCRTAAGTARPPPSRRPPRPRATSDDRRESPRGIWLGSQFVGDHSSGWVQAGLSRLVFSSAALFATARRPRRGREVARPARSGHASARKSKTLRGRATRDRKRRRVAPRSLRPARSRVRATNGSNCTSGRDGHGEAAERLLRKRRAGAPNAGSGRDPRAGSSNPTARATTRRWRIRFARRETAARCEQLRETGDRGAPRVVIRPEIGGGFGGC
jgi:hypothetical protein